MSEPTVPAPPVLGHVEAVELIDTGSWLAASGPFTPTTDALAAAVAAVDCPAVRRPILKLGHSGEHGQGDPALGYVANLRLANEGHTLVGDFRGMPGWLTDVDAEGQSVLASAYPDRSIEGEYDYRCQLGHTHPFVVHAVALLGVERPAVGTLQSLQELYGVTATITASEGGRLIQLTREEDRVPAPVTANATTEDVRRAYYGGPGQAWDLWIREMYVDPPELIVDNDADGSILRVPYEVAADGTVTFGDPQPVRVTYVAARATAGAAAASWHTRAESRATADTSSAPATPPAEPAAGPTPTQEDGTMPNTLNEGLRQRLGITDADATDEALLSALDSRLAEATGPATQPVAASIPEGMQLIESATLDTLRADASAGRQAREQQLVERRTSLVDAAIKDGRVPPARRDHWIEQLKADPGSESVLASLAPGLVPVTAQGHDGGEPTTPTDPAAGDDYWFPGVTTTSREG